MSHIRHHLPMAFGLSLLLSACAQSEIFDLVGDTGPPAQTSDPWPSLIPAAQFDQRVTNTAQTSDETLTQTAELDARVARLRQRAARLKGPILSRGERAELRTALKVQ